MLNGMWALAILIIVFFSGIGLAPVKADPTDSNWVLVWSDECNGPAGSEVDSSKWNLVHSGGGFGNNEIQFYTNRKTNSFMMVTAIWSLKLYVNPSTAIIILLPNFIPKIKVTGHTAAFRSGPSFPGAGVSGPLFG